MEPAPQRSDRPPPLPSGSCRGRREATPTSPFVPHKRGPSGTKRVAWKKGRSRGQAASEVPRQLPDFPAQMPLSEQADPYRLGAEPVHLLVGSWEGLGTPVLEHRPRPPRARAPEPDSSWPSPVTGGHGAGSAGRYGNEMRPAMVSFCARKCVPSWSRSTFAKRDSPALGNAPIRARRFLLRVASPANLLALWKGAP